MSIRLIALPALLLAAGSALAQGVPPGLTLEPFVSGLNSPIGIRHPGDDSDRLFVFEKGGTIRVVENGTLLPTPFLTQAVTTSSESGLLGLAFHPDYETNGYFFVAFTAPGAEPRLGSTPDQVIARFQVSANPAVAVPGSRLDIIRIPDLAGNHNGGDLHFGPDGYLYYTSGDGGPQNDPHGFALCAWKKPADNTINNCAPGGGTNYWLLGKVLRLDVDTPTAAATADMCGATVGQPANYSIPAGNPQLATGNTCDEIWHTGLRNPWRFSFDRETGDMYIGDVGQGAREEVSRAPSGTPLHFGWGCMEGFRVNKTAAPCSSADPANSFPGSTLPILDYPRAEGFSISGGFMFRGPIQPMQGVYWFADYGSGRVWAATEPASGPWPKSQLFTQVGTVGFGEDKYGNLYLVNINTGSILRFTSTFIFADGFE